MNYEFFLNLLKSAGEISSESSESSDWEEENQQDQQDLAKRSEQEKKEMDFAQQENNNRDILAFFCRYSLPHRYIISTFYVEKG